MFGGGCWSVLVVGNDTDSNFLYVFLLKVCTYAVVNSSCLVWFLIFFWKLDPLHDASATTKGGSEVVCDLRERPGSTMIVP